MHMPSRRALLRSFVLAAPALALVGCATPQQIAAIAVSDIGLLANGLTAFSPLLATIPGITTALIAQVTAYLSQAVSIAQSVSAATTQVEGQSVIQQIESYFTDAVNLLASFTLPAQLASIVADIKVLIPVIETAVGLVIASAARRVGAVWAKLPSKTLAQARADLQALAH
jgi:hypothetical protein